MPSDVKVAKSGDQSQHYYICEEYAICNPATNDRERKFKNSPEMLCPIFVFNIIFNVQVPFRILDMVEF